MWSGTHKSSTCSFKNHGGFEALGVERNVGLNYAHSLDL